MNWIFLIAGIIGLALTIKLSMTGQMTLSQRAQALFPRWLDWLIGLGGAALMCYFQTRCLHLNIWLFGYWLLFWGHIWIANKERYKK
ncbi:hypothetical protein LCGC14_1725380 [marine sediment metagenome]|uniref:Uncharacterized protein n=1 Tax=marine sediment metagenome TaxID=412755 RepID=A0A0F9HB94_9ZZZZ